MGITHGYLHLLFSGEHGETIVFYSSLIYIITHLCLNYWRRTNHTLYYSTISTLTSIFKHWIRIWKIFQHNQHHHVNTKIWIKSIFPHWIRIKQGSPHNQHHHVNHLPIHNKCRKQTTIFAWIISISDHPCQVSILQSTTIPASTR